MRCHSLSRSGKRGPHKGAACPPYELWEHRLFPAFSGGKTELFCIGLTVSIWVPPAPKKCSFISVRQSIWLHKLGLFLFCTPPPHPSYLQCASYPISFWRFSSNSYHLPIQEEPGQQGRSHHHKAENHYKHIMQASAGCLSSPRRNKAPPPIFTMIFSPWERIKQHPLLHTHKLALFFQTPPPINTNLCGESRLNTEEAERPHILCPPQLGHSFSSINIQ